MSISEVLSEELEVINAIYGEGTCQVISTSTNKTRIQLKLPAASYEFFEPKVTGRRNNQTTGSWKRNTIQSDVIFFADFPIAYPQVMPQVAHLDVSLFEYYNEGMWKIQLALMIFLREIFMAGEVCIYDWFLRSIQAVHCLNGNGFDWTTFARVAPDFTINEKSWRWTMRQRPLDLEIAMTTSECTICQDEHIVYEMVDMVCGHRFCTDCFHEGWNVAQKVKEPYACCNHRIPSDMIRMFIGIDEAQAKRYERLLIERDTPQPVWCSQPDCTGFLGSMLQFIITGTNNGECTECGVSTCVLCGSSAHKGDCELGELEDLMKHFEIRRCPNCGQPTMKNGGCSHMRCGGCGARYT